MCEGEDGAQRTAHRDHWTVSALRATLRDKRNYQGKHGGIAAKERQYQGQHGGTIARSLRGETDTGPKYNVPVTLSIRCCPFVPCPDISLPLRSMPLLFSTLAFPALASTSLASTSLAVIVAPPLSHLRMDPPIPIVCSAFLPFFCASKTEKSRNCVRKQRSGKSAHKMVV